MHILWNLDHGLIGDFLLVHQFVQALPFFFRLPEWPPQLIELLIDFGFAWKMLFLFQFCNFVFQLIGVISENQVLFQIFLVAMFDDFLLAQEFSWFNEFLPEHFFFSYQLQILFLQRGLKLLRSGLVILSLCSNLPDFVSNNPHFLSQFFILILHLLILFTQPLNFCVQSLFVVFHWLIASTLNLTKRYFQLLDVFVLLN